MSLAVLTQLVALAAVTISLLAGGFSLPALTAAAMLASASKSLHALDA
jgi:hypothetical protein